MRISVAALLLLCSACASSGAAGTDEKIDTAIRTLEAALPSCQERFREDDARIGKLLNARTVSATDRKAAEDFVRDRGTILERMRALLTELRDIRAFLHQEPGDRTETELVQETEKRIKTWQEKNKALSEDLDHVRLRHEEIRRRLMAAPLR